MFNDYRIKVTNTAIIVDNYVLGESQQLERMFSKYDPITHKYNLEALYYDADNKKLYIPAGADLYKIKKYLNESYFTRINPTKFDKTATIKMKYGPRDPEQVEALSFMCDVNQYADMQGATQKMLSLSTGKGKTYCSIATIGFYQIKSIIITDSNTLLSQWKKNILEYTNLTESDVFSINGSDVCNMILNGSSGKANNASIYLCSHGTLRSFGNRYGWEKISELFEYLGIGLKFFDEAHLTFDNMLMIDYFTNVWRTYYVTATPARSDTRENQIFQISIKNVPMIDLFNKDKDPHTSYICIKWNSNPTPKDISYCKHRVYKFDRIKYVHYLIRKPEFYDMMRVAMDLALKCKGRVLMYIATNEGVLAVYKWINVNYPELMNDVGIFTSLVEKEEKIENKVNKRILLSTSKSAGVGQHIEGLKMTMVIAEPYKSKVLAQQSLGRTRDEDSMYIEFLDMGFKYTMKYYYDKLPTFKKYAKDVSDMVMDKYELRKRAENLENAHNLGFIRSPFVFADNRFDYPDIPYIKSEKELDEERIKPPGPRPVFKPVRKNNNPGDFRSY